MQDFLGDDPLARLVVDLVEIEVAYASWRGAAALSSGDADGVIARRLLQRRLLVSAHRQGRARARLLEAAERKIPNRTRKAGL